MFSPPNPLKGELACGPLLAFWACGPPFGPLTRYLAFGRLLGLRPAVGLAVGTRLGTSRSNPQPGSYLAHRFTQNTQNHDVLATEREPEGQAQSAQQ